MGFRTPSEINRELESFDRKKRKESEASEKRSGKRHGPSELLEKPQALPRIAAYFIDSLIVGVVMIIPGVLLQFLLIQYVSTSIPEPLLESLIQNKFQMTEQEALAAFQESAQEIQRYQIRVLSIFAVAWFLFISIFYTLWYGFFYSTYGASPGKMIFHLEVRDDFDESRTSYVRAFFREVIGKYVSAFLLCIGFLMGLLNKERRCLHDYLTGTKVVRVDKISRS